MTEDVEDIEEKPAKKKKIRTLKEIVISALRRAWRNSHFYYDVKNKAKEEYFIIGKKGQKIRRVKYKCAKCGRTFPDKVNGRSAMAVDHISPIILPTEGFVSWDRYIERMFSENLQVLCNYKGEIDGVLSCHEIKCREERAIAVERRKKEREALGFGNKKKTSKKKG